MIRNIRSKFNAEKYLKRIKKASFVFIILYMFQSNVLAVPLYGPAPSNATNAGVVPGLNVDTGQPPNGAVPSLNGPGMNAPAAGGGPQGGNPPSNPTSPSPQGIMGPGPQGGQLPGSGGPASATQSTSEAPTFMNNAMPNSTNPFLPTNISPGLITAPLENAYLQSGVPQLMAPLMSVVYRPFGLTYFQPNPFQVVPQGSVSLTTTYGLMSNINYQPNESFTDWGSFYSIMPAISYSNFDDYGYISLMGNVSYYQYNGADVSSFLNEMAGISAGSYLGTRVFVGVQELGNIGESPQSNASLLGFFHGITPYYDNMADAEVGIALTPKLSFIQAASDMYFEDTGFGAGFMNLQSLTDTLNYMDKNDFLSLSYIYQQAFFSDFPNFISDGLSGTAMRSLSPTTSFGVGGSASYFLMGQNNLSFVSGGQGFSPDFYDFIDYAYYGIFSHYLTRSISVVLEGGWNGVQFFDGQSFQGPMVDLNIAYTGPHLGLGINAGEFESTMGPTYGVEMGPVYTQAVMGYLNYSFSPKTSAFASVGYSVYTFQQPYSYANTFFQTLQPNQSYNGTIFSQTDGISYTPYPWLNTSIDYNFTQFTTNIPDESIAQNMIFAMMTFVWSFY